MAKNGNAVAKVGHSGGEEANSFSDRCSSCYMSCSSMMTRALETFFFKFGSLVGTFPWITILISVAVCAIASGGLAFYYESTDDEFLWTPTGSVFVGQKKWISKNFPKDKRYESVIISGGNVLNNASIKYLFDLNDAIKNVNASTGETYLDLCESVPSPPKQKPDQEVPKSCIESGILQLWPNYNKTQIDALSDQDILEAVTKAMKTPSLNATLSPLLSNIKKEIQDNITGKVISAEAAMTIFIMHMNGSIDNHGSLKDPVADDWEANVLDLIVNKDDLNLNGDKIDGRPEWLKVDVLVDSSFLDAMYDMVNSNSVILYAGGIFMVAFVCSVMGKFNALEQRIVLSFCGLMVIGLSVLSCFGVCFYFKLYSTQMQQMVPFLLLGIGVDDIFVIAKAMDNLSVLDKGKPAQARLGLCMKAAGVSITVTSMTNISSFLISGTSRMPIIRSFCIFCGVGIVFLYFYSVTFFAACLALDEKRIDSRRPMDARCIKQKPVDWRPNTFSQIEFGKYIFGTTIPNFILRPWAKVLVLLATLSIFGTAIYGCTQLTTNYDPVQYMSKTSYQVSFYNVQQTLFPEDGERIEIYIGNISYHNKNNSEGLLQIKEGIQDLPSVIGSSFQFWYTDFYEQQNCADTSKKFSCFTERGFSVNLVEFFDKATNLKYLNDIKIEKSNSTEQVLAKLSDIDPQDLPKIPKILASRASFQHEYLPNTETQNIALDNVRQVLANITFPGEDFSTPIPYSFTYVQWTANELLSHELVRNLGLNFAAVTFVTIVFLPNIQMVVMTLFCVVFTVGNVAGYTYFMGLAIDPTVCIIMMLSVGLAVDYCAHVAVTYMCCENETRQTKARKSLSEVGAAIFNGGFSTFLAFFLVGFSDSYVFTTFFKMFSLVALFGLYHGLIFLPVALSLIGPEGPGARDIPKFDSDDDIKAHVNWAFENDTEAGKFDSKRNTRL